MSKFCQFPLLPFELRNQIWTFILPAPRLIEIRAISGKLLISEDGRPDQIPFSHVYTTKAAVPTILQINSETRSIGLQHYQLAFDSNPRPSREMMVRNHPNLPAKTEMPFETPAMIYCSFLQGVLLPRRDDSVFESMPIDVPAEGFEHDVFRAMDKQILRSIRYLVMPAMPFRKRDVAEMQAYFKCLTGLKGIVVIEFGLENDSEETKAMWCGKVSKELTLILGKGAARVRMCIDQEVLELEVGEGRIWDSGLKVWD